MRHKIGLLSDIHGNVTALEAVIEDSIREGVTEYWLLGDLVMPGPGASELFQLIEGLPLSVFVKGNWEDCFLAGLAGDINWDDPTDIYIGRLSKYLWENISAKELDKIKELPLYDQRTINQLNFGISHNLPAKNYGGFLATIKSQENFDELFPSGEIDIAVYGHIHHQMLRYGSAGQMIINPGAVGQPFSFREKLRKDLRAYYAILEIDDEGLAQVDFKKVYYDVGREIARAKQARLPYVDLYQTLLTTGRTQTRNRELLAEINEQLGYKEELESFFKSLGSSNKDGKISK